MVNESLHGNVVDIRKELVTEKRIHPLVEGVSPVVDRRLFEWIAFAADKRFEPDFGSLSEGDVRG